jgi:hypothetical protein
MTDGPISLPSGRSVTLIDVINDAPGAAGLTMRFRFLLEGLEQGADYETNAADMQALCDSYALPRIPVTGPAPAQVVISLHDRVIPFGETVPEAVQVFEAYRIEDGACIWEMF